MGLPGGAVLGQHVTVAAQGGAYERSRSLAIFINGQRQIPLVANPPCHGQGQSRPTPEENVVPSRQISQPRIYGASDANWDTSLEGTRQAAGRTRASCEGGAESRPREREFGMTGTIPVTSTNHTTEGDCGSQEWPRQAEAVGAPDAADVNEINQGTSPQGCATPDHGPGADARPSTEGRPDEEGSDHEVWERHVHS